MNELTRRNIKKSTDEKLAFFSDTIDDLLSEIEQLQNLLDDKSDELEDLRKDKDREIEALQDTIASLESDQ